MTRTVVDKRIVVGITGASGAAYARGLVKCLCNAGVEVHLIVTPAGRRLMSDELGLTDIDARTLVGQPSDRLIVHPYRDVGAVVASGSFRTNGMIVCPCSILKLLQQQLLI